MEKMFDIKLADYGDRPCLLSDREVMSYHAVADACTRLQSVLPEHKQLILVKASSDIETLIAYLTCLRSDQAFIMLDIDIDPDFINDIIIKYQPNWIWEKQTSDQQYIISYRAYGLRSYNPNKLDLHQDLSLMLSTSGSTGSPKMVKLTKKNIEANCRSIVEYLQIDSNHRAITNLPLHYSYGLSIINTHLAVGASIVVTDQSILSERFWQTFKRHKVTTLSGVPYHYEIFKRIGLSTIVVAVFALYDSSWR